MYHLPVDSLLWRSCARHDLHGLSDFPSPSYSLRHAAEKPGAEFGNSPPRPPPTYNNAAGKQLELGPETDTIPDHHGHETSTPPPGLPGRQHRLGKYSPPQRHRYLLPPRLLGARVLAAIVHPSRVHVGGQLRRRQHDRSDLVPYRAADDGWRGLGATCPVSLRLRIAGSLRNSEWADPWQAHDCAEWAYPDYGTGARLGESMCITVPAGRAHHGTSASRNCGLHDAGHSVVVGAHRGRPQELEHRRRPLHRVPERRAHACRPDPVCRRQGSSAQDPAPRPLHVTRVSREAPKRGFGDVGKRRRLMGFRLLHF